MFKQIKLINEEYLYIDRYFTKSDLYYGLLEHKCLETEIKYSNLLKISFKDSLDKKVFWVK